MADDDVFNQTFVESELRKQRYKELLDMGSEVIGTVDTNSITENIEALTHLVLQSNELINEGETIDRIGRSAEIVLDAQVLKVANELMTVTATRMENENFSDDAFTAALLQNVTDDLGVLDWSKLDPMIASKWKTVSFSTSMFGSFDFDEEYRVPESQRKRQVRKRAELGVEKKPTSVTQTQQNKEKGSAKIGFTLDAIKKIYRANNNKAIPFYQLIIDPDNMMHTFDNSFQISFLFRDGLISFEKGDDDLPAIRPISENNRPPKPSENTSFVSRLDMGIINKYIKKYNIRKPMLNLPRE